MPSEHYRTLYLFSYKELSMAIASEIYQNLPSKGEVASNVASAAGKGSLQLASVAATGTVAAATLASQIAFVMTKTIAEQVYENLPERQQAIANVSEFAQEAASFAGEITYAAGYSAANAAYNTAKAMVDSSSELANSIVNSALEGVASITGNTATDTAGESSTNAANTTAPTNNSELREVNRSLERAILNQ